MNDEAEEPEEDVNDEAEEPEEELDDETEEAEEEWDDETEEAEEEWYDETEEAEEEWYDETEEDEEEEEEESYIMAENLPPFFNFEETSFTLDTGDESSLSWNLSVRDYAQDPDENDEITIEVEFGAAGTIFEYAEDQISIK